MITKPNRASKIVVTDCETSAGLACIRDLGLAGFDVYATGRLANSPAARSKFTKKHRLLPCPWIEPRAAHDSLIGFAYEVRADAILPVSEASIAATLRWSELIPNELLLMRANTEVLDVALSKLKTFERAVSLKLPTAHGWIVDSSELPVDPTEADFPMVIRTDNRWHRSGAYQKGQSWIVTSRSELWSLHRELRSMGQKYLMQKWVAGQGHGAFLLMDNGQVQISQTHERLAEIPWTGGVSARRRISYDEKLLRSACEFLQGLSLNGIAMVEYRRTNIDQKLVKNETSSVLIELNARPWGSLALALHAGLPFIAQWAKQKGLRGSAIHHRSTKSRPLPSDCKRVGTTLYPGEILYIKSILQSWRRSQLNIPQAASHIFSSIKTILSIKTRYDYLWFRDPLPCIAQFKILASLFPKIFTNPFLSLLDLIFDRVRRLQINTIKERQERIFFRSRNSTFEIDSDAPQRILIVCFGNRCRSPFAEKILNSYRIRGIEIVSRGLEVTERDVPERFLGVFRDSGINPENHRAEQLTLADLKSSDLVITMEKKHGRYIGMHFGYQFLGKILLLSEIVDTNDNSEIEDPFNLNPSEAREIFAKIRQICKNWFEDNVIDDSSLKKPKIAEN
jgi:protein-tyrosine-phosphatase